MLIVFVRTVLTRSELVWNEPEFVRKELIRNLCPAFLCVCVRKGSGQAGFVRTVLTRKALLWNKRACVRKELTQKLAPVSLSERFGQGRIC